jgi:hypothetical protein
MQNDETCDMKFDGCPGKTTVFVRLEPIVKGGPRLLCCSHCWIMAYRDAKKIEGRLPEGSVVALQVKRKPRVLGRRGDRLFNDAVKAAKRSAWLDDLFD